MQRHRLSKQNPPTEFQWNTGVDVDIEYVIESNAIDHIITAANRIATIIIIAITTISLV